MEGSPQTAVQTVYTLSCIKRNCWIIYRHNHPKENKVLKNNIPISDAFFSIFNFHNLIWQFQLLTEKVNQEQSSNSTSIDIIFYSFQQNLVHHYNGKMWKRGPPCDFYESAIKFSALGRLSVTRTMEQSRSYTLNTWTLSTDLPPTPSFTYFTTTQTECVILLHQALISVLIVSAICVIEIKLTRST